jgi:predicted nucleic acid-binding protein
LTIYADSSFFVSLHIVDRHSPEVWRRMHSNPALYLTPIHRIEFAHAAYLHVFWKKATALEAQNAVSAFDEDCANGIWTLVAVPESAYMRSVELAARYTPSIGVRSLDSLHVACALELGADKFWTFDDRQKQLAEAVGLDVAP